MSLYLFFFFNDTATTEIYTLSDTLSLHDALPDPVRAAGPHELDRRLLRHVDPVRGCEVLSEHAARQVHAQDDRDPLAARLAARRPDAWPRRGDDPGAQTRAPQRDR